MDLANCRYFHFFSARCKRLGPPAEQTASKMTRKWFFMQIALKRQVQHFQYQAKMRRIYVYEIESRFWLFFKLQFGFLFVSKLR